MTERSAPTIRIQDIMLLVMICFFLSGLTGLIYQILWTRMIVKIIGGAPFAVSIVLTVFMAGLGLGSYLASRYIDRITETIKLVRLYGVLEILIGVYGLVLPLLLITFRPLYSIIYNQLFNYFLLYNFLTFIGCSVLLLIPVTCMGATLPILCRFYVSRLSHLGTHTGRLYGLNTIGAAVGALLGGFWLINLFGVWGSLLTAIFINVLIGLACILVSYKSKLTNHENISRNISQEVEVAPNVKENYPGVVVAALIIFAVSGFCAMASEVIWTKLLGLIVGPTTYSFTIVLTTFIFGLALGSIFFGWLADKTGRPFLLLIITQISAAIFVLLISQLLGNSQLFFSKVIFTYLHEFTQLSTAKAVSLFIFMILPTFCFGATFPLVSKIYTRSVEKVGRSVGRAYSINTIGAVLGSFCAGFLLIPLVGKEMGLSIVVGLQLLTILIIVGVIYSRKKENIPRLIYLSVPILLTLVFCFQYPQWNRRLFSEGKYHRFKEFGADINNYGWLETLFNGPKILARFDKNKLLYYGDGIGGFTTVLKYTYPLGDTYLSMANAGKVEASTRGDMRTQTLMAHFPLLFHPDPKHVMVVGLASGVTAGEALYYPIDQLDVVEINKEVVTASNFFIPWNNNVLMDPRTNLIIQDGRAHLGLTDQNYDIIISEPSNPWMAGLATLFTRNFFTFAHNRLNDDGIFIQFTHSYQMDWFSFSMIGRTFTEVFPQSLLISTSPSGIGPDFLLVGFKNKMHLDLETARNRLRFAQQSNNIILTDPKLYFRLIVTEDLDHLFGSGPINTDSKPLLEFAAPKLLYASDETIERNILAKQKYTDSTKKIVDELNGDIEAQIDFATYALSVYSPFEDMIDLSRANPDQKQRFNEIMDNYITSTSINYGEFTNEELKERWRSIQIKSIEDRIDSMPDKALSYAFLAGLYMEEKKQAEAITYYNRSLELDYQSEVSHCNIAIAHYNQRQFEKAIFHYNEALRIRPYYADAHSNLGTLLATLGKLGEAMDHFNRALNIRPDFAKAHYDLGLTLAGLNRLNEAVEHFTLAVQSRPELTEAHYNLGVACVKQGKYGKAITHFTEALKIRPDYNAARNGLKTARDGLSKEK